MLISQDPVAHNAYRFNDPGYIATVDYTHLSSIFGGVQGAATTIWYYYYCSLCIPFNDMDAGYILKGCCQIILGCPNSKICYKYLQLGKTLEKLHILLFLCSECRNLLLSSPTLVKPGIKQEYLNEFHQTEAQIQAFQKIEGVAQII
jgi:hypothetical protein